MPLKKLAQLFGRSLVKHSDEELMRMIQDDKMEAFEELYERFRKPLFSYLTQQVKKDQAEEILQDVFIKILENRMSFRFESKVSTWLWTVTRNKVIDHWRSAGHRMDQLAVGVTDDEGHEYLEAELDSHEEMILKKTNRNQLDLCLEELALNQKEALMLQTQSELSMDEIGQMMNTTVSAVKSLLFRAKEKLMDCFKRGGHL